MTTIASAQVSESRTAYALAKHTAAQARCCEGSEMASAFESVPGPRRKRGASDASDIQFDCVDPADTRNEPATVVQRIPV